MDILRLVGVTVLSLTIMVPSASALLVGEEDGAPSHLSNNCWALKVANGNLTSNSDGTCSLADQGGAGAGDNVTVNSTAIDTTANLLDGDIDWTIVDGGAGGPDDITATLDATYLSGLGYVVGPASATDNALVRFDSTTGKLIQDGQTTEDDSGNVTVAGTLAVGSGGNERLTFTTSGEYIDGTTDDFILLQGVGGADNTDLRIDLDGTHPVIDSPTDANIEFLDDVIVPTEVYGAGWNASNEVPTKDAVYDKIETISAGSGDVTAASSFGTDNVIIRADGTGKGVQSSGPSIDDTGQLTVPATGSSGGLVIGDDTNLYDNGTNALKTDDAFTALTLTATNNIFQTATSNLFKTNNGYTPVIQSLVSTSSASDLRNFDMTMTNSSTGGAYNIDATATRSGAGSSSNLFAIRGKAVFTGTSGTQTTAYGIYGYGQINGSGGTITDAYGVYAAPFTVTAGTITNNYALGVGGAVNHLDSDSAGTTTCTTLSGLMTCAVA